MEILTWTNQDAIINLVINTRRKMMARNCPSYKSMYAESQQEVCDLKRKLRHAEQQIELKDRYIDSIPDDEDEHVTINATARELKEQTPFLDLEGRAILIVHL